MHRLLTITTAASDLSLLTIEEMRAAAGISGSGSDTALRAMERRIAAAIMSECNIAIGPGKPPTLLRETLTETIYQACGEGLVLSRRHDVEISSLVEDTVMLLAADYMVDPESGIINKLCDDYPTWWTARKVVVVYDAGFETVPDDLKMAAIDFFRLSWLEQKRDPSLKSEVVDIPDVRRVERGYWVGSVPGQSNEGAVPDIVAGQLTRFRNMMVA
ncbi:hypothetical protein [Mesorhizobium sp.]|uniref:hypothetical protein n=1 Tax=Mesorhizobium sp. TaxID=1871066 RepID=UPI000FE3993D|nr:hypothetical protein [Mesorhizobium sp.]RWQ16095.1 MAG: hypothetical protein EOR92_22735 [Mesorhizobium sp.]